MAKEVVTTVLETIEPKKEVMKRDFLFEKYLSKKYPINPMADIKITRSHMLKGIIIPKGSMGSLGRKGKTMAVIINNCKDPDHSSMEKFLAKE